MESSVQHLAGTVGCLPNNHAPFCLLSEPISFFTWQCAQLQRMMSLVYTDHGFRISLQWWLAQGEHVTQFSAPKLRLLRNSGEKNVPPWLKGGTWWKRPFVTSHFYLLEVVVWRRDVCSYASHLGTLAITGRGQQGDSKSPSFADVMRIAFLQNCLPLDVLFYEINTIIGTTLGQLFPS